MGKVKRLMASLLVVINIIALALFAGLSTRPQRIMDWVIDAHMWLKTLMPQYRSIFAVYALIDAHKAALRAGLTSWQANIKVDRHLIDRPLS